VPIPEQTVAAVVAEAGSRMRDARYAQSIVGAWVQAQPDAARYLSASAQELGGAAAVVNVAFHCALIADCYRRHSGRALRAIKFVELDRVTRSDRGAALRKLQPALADYLDANVEGPLRQAVELMALAMDYVS
jgi:hypothetical protein